MLAKFNSLVHVCEMPDVRNFKTIFQLSGSLDKVISACTQLILDLMSGIPTLFFASGSLAKNDVKWNRT